MLFVSGLDLGRFSVSDMVLGGFLNRFWGFSARRSYVSGLGAIKV